MTKQNTTKRNWDTDNPFFSCKEAYDEFVETMILAADYESLPMSYQVEQPETLTMNDIRQFSKRFKQDTGLNIEFNFSTCDHCDKLHCIMIVDELPEWKKESDCS